MDGNPKQILISEEPLNVHFLDLDPPHDFRAGKRPARQRFPLAATFVGIVLLGARLTKNGAANF
jgi:hypothetical protein